MWDLEEQDAAEEDRKYFYYVKIILAFLLELSINLFYFD